MLYNTLHQPVLRLLAAIAGELMVALSLALFIAPLGLYTGGVMGVCQLLRTLLQSSLGWNSGSYDLAGILYFLANIPILIFAWHQLGRGMAVKTIVCTLAYSLFYSLIPVPKAPIVEDYLTACLLGGILTGVGCGIVLTCGCSSGGLDVIGLCLSRRGSGFTVGRFSLTFNVFLYAACLILFSPEVAIYSVIYNFFASIVLDRMHQQNVNVLALIFTREDPSPLSRYIMDRLGRGATCWEGTGAYTGAGVHVLCVCLTKYEIDQLLHAVRTMDPTAFLTVQKGVQVWGNFPRKLG